MVSDTSFLSSFNNFLSFVKDYLHPNYKSAEGLLGDCVFKIRIVEKKLFFPKKYIICFSSAKFQIDEEGTQSVERWKWEEYEEKDEHNELLKLTSRHYLRVEDVIEHYKENGRYDWFVSQ